MAINFAKQLSMSGYTVVSGLAIGIDSYAHIGAMLGISKTIAILPCGLKNIYPKENRELYTQIIENDGLILSEYDSNIEITQKNFRERNRLIAGISEGILIVEGSYRSGTSITAEYGRKNKREIFCIPQSLDSKTSYTTNYLIKQGNNIVTNINDIIDILENNTNKKTRSKIRIEKNLLEVYKKKFSKKGEKINEIETSIAKKYPLYKYIKYTPINIEELVKKSKENISEINYQLTMLTIDKYIKELPDKSYIRNDIKIE